MVNIRYGLPADRMRLEALQFRASTAFPDYRDAILAHPESIRISRELFTQRRVRVAEIAGVPIGFSVILSPIGGISELDGLFVEPACWRRGIGTALMRDAMNLARTERSDAIEVTANPLAVSFYTKLGFVPLCETPTQFGPALRMRCSLDQEGR
jgi:GNAT superfamily N-acetyltransferase